MTNVRRFNGFVYTVVYQNENLTWCETPTLWTLFDANQCAESLIKNHKYSQNVAITRRVGC